MESVLIKEGRIEMIEKIFNVSTYHLCGDLDGGVGSEALREMGSHVVERTHTTVKLCCSGKGR